MGSRQKDAGLQNRPLPVGNTVGLPSGLVRRQEERPRKIRHLAGRETNDAVRRLNHVETHVVALGGIRRVSHNNLLRLRKPLVLPRIDPGQVEYFSIPAHADR